MEFPFHFFAPLEAFEKSEAGAKRYRIGGIFSSEERDRQGERIRQSGLDFSEALKAGFFNDNHTKATTGILGYPTSIKRYRKGQKLPNGQVAKSNCTWGEGYLLDDDDGRAIWKKAKALQGTGRSLSFSVEGKVTKRDPNDRRNVTKAIVRNIAITREPVNMGSGMELLSKSMAAVERGDYEEAQRLSKAMTVGARADNSAVTGPRTGEGAASVVAQEALEKDQKDLFENLKEKKPEEQAKKVYKSLSDGEAIAFLRKRLPGASVSTLGRIVDVTRRLKAAGKL